MKLIHTFGVLLTGVTMSQAATLYYQDFSNSSPVSDHPANNPIIDNTAVTSMVAGEVISGGNASTQSTNGDYTITINTAGTAADNYIFNETGDAGFKYDDSQYTFESGNVSFQEGGITYTGKVTLKSQCNVGDEFFSINSVELVQDDTTGDVYVDIDFNYFADTDPTQSDSLLLTLDFGVNDVGGLEIEELIGVPLGSNTTGAGVYRHHLIEVPVGARYNYQAEGMSLSDYTVATSALAEGGAYVQTGVSGTASQVFSGVSGTYTIDTYYFDETDGLSTYELRVDDVLVDSWVADATTGTAGISEASKAIRRSQQISVQSGSVIELTGTGDGGEFARLDQIVLNAEYFSEAESMTLDGFSAQPLNAASDGQMIQLSAPSGTASMTLNDIITGYYDIETIYFDESDGDAVYKIFVDGVLVDAWSASLEIGSAAPDASNRVMQQTQQVFLSSGQTLELLAYSDVGEFCRTDSLRLRKSLVEAPVHSMSWNADGTVSSLQLNGTEQLSAQTGHAELRIFNGDKVVAWDMTYVTEQSGVVELATGDEEDVKMLIQVDEYDRHLLLRLIGVEKLPGDDASLGIRMTLPISNAVNVVALDDNAKATVSGSEIRLGWNKLSERDRFPGGVFALYADGTAAENAAALAEIDAMHVNVTPLTLPNEAPVADPQSISLDEDSSVALTLSGSDADGDSLTYAVVTNPSNGSLSGTAPNLTYTPNANYYGSDSFTYTVNDGTVSSTVATVSITVNDVIEDGLIAHLSLNEGTGSAVNDSENNFDATMSSATWVAGLDGNALDFDGSSSSVDLPSAAFDHITDEITVAMWVYGGVNQPRNDSIFYAVNSSGSRLLNVHLPWGNGSVYWDAGNAGFDRINKVAAASDYKGQWNHWVFTKNATSGVMAIYLNGALWHSGTGLTKQMSGITSAKLGSQISGLSYQGSIDDVQLYNVALDATEIATLTNSYTAVNGVPKVWLIANGIAPTDAGALGDTDNDGLANWEEYYAGNDPMIADNPAGIRVTEYYLSTGDFTGTTATITLNQSLANDYFILVRGSHDGNGLSMPDNDYARVTGVPSGGSRFPGNMAGSGNTNAITLTRTVADLDWEGVVTVVECTNPSSSSGFELVDVLSTNLSGTSGTDSSASWSDVNQVVLFGGYRGGGALFTGAPTSRNHGTSIYTRLFPSGSGTINWSRDAGGETLYDAVMTTFVIEWGSEWTVQHVNVTGSNGGDGADVTGEYTTAPISSVARDNTWVWGTGTRADAGIGDSAEACLITLGDGVSQNANESSVAVGSEYTDAYNFDVYTMTHSGLAVDHRFKVDGDSASSDLAVPVDSATAGVRFGWVYNGCNGTGTYFPRPRLWSRYTADGEITISRGFSGQNFPAWVQGIDFSGLNN